MDLRRRLQLSSTFSYTFAECGPPRIWFAHIRQRRFKVQLRKTIVTIAGVIAVASVLALGLQAQEAKKNWKDRPEYDLYVAITKDNINDAERLDELK